MTTTDERLTGEVAGRVRARLIVAGQAPTAQAVAAAVRDEGLLVGDDTLLGIAGALGREFAGAGVLEAWLRTPGVTDVLVNGPHDVWVDDGGGLRRVDLSLNSEEQVRLLAQRLAAAAGRRLDEAMPCVDAVLQDGTRLHAVIPPIATRGTVISLRVPRRAAFTLDDLIATGTIDGWAASWLEAVIRARLSFLISGCTGSGKTTILSTLLGCIPAEERIVIVEDSAELRPVHDHVVALQSRPPNIEGAGLVTMRDLVRQALRMRPDRIVVGEVRGAEVVDLLAALNTGHEGGCGTVHANSAEDVPARLQALGLMAGLDRAALQALVGAGLEVIIHLDKNSQGRRQLAGVHLLTTREAASGGQFLRTSAALLRGQRGLRPGPAMERLRQRVRQRGVLAPRSPARSTSRNDSS